jgi:predicted small lipoprotein YifL
MQRAISSVLILGAVAFACAGCGTLLPDSSVSADASVSWSDVREIERLLPVIGIRHPITGISQTKPGEYWVTCHGKQLGEWAYEEISFAVYHRGGRWLADRSSIRRGVGTIVSDARPVSQWPNQAMQRTAPRSDA